MSVLATMKRSCVLMVCAVLGAGAIDATPLRRAAPRPVGLYDRSPDHLWNRIHDVFHVRVAPGASADGFDTVDPLLWRETRYLLTPPSSAIATRVLDDFLNSHGERLVRDPLRRAVFQHDMWDVFDWLAFKSDGERTARAALMRRVARVIRRVALPRKDIDALPDTYAAAVASGAFAAAPSSSPQVSVPTDLFTPGGPWVAVGGSEPLAVHHAAELGTSAFTILWSLPGGAAGTRAFLERLWSFPQPFIADGMFEMARDGELRATVNPALPPIPDNTRIALVRTMLLVDDAGAIVPTRIVQSIQVRAFPRAAFAEVEFSREALFAGTTGGLRVVTADDRRFITFSAKGMDPFEGHGPLTSKSKAPVLDGCVNCHHVGFEPPIATVLSLRRMLKPWPFVDPQHDRWSRWFTPTIVAAEAKSRSYEWGVLQGLWHVERW